ncbi:acetyltransferase [Devosia soli]|uniref:Acetyltransferase n=1 Tax=Devosia soli TaxID=361041 RepID=A0A0F5L8P7_9HYPH|nr:GNAT family N-acetyltransferase [Devosia soli]KKB78766.1 acetyltransferase [Devosia soli]
MVSVVLDPLPSDDEMRALWLASWGDGGPASWQPVLKQSLVHVGAYDGPRLVGYVNVACDGGSHAFLLDTCVHRDFQRQGIATLLVKTAEAAARQRGAKWLHVDFEPHLTAFYRACGFRPTEAGLIAL